MPSDEQRVRTMAGWIGVEISRSRVRTPGKPGYGLYRVRGSVALGETRIGNGVLHAWRESEWTAYAFTLSGVGMAVKQAIRWGTPAGPAPLKLAYGPMPDPTCVDVPTRWTSAYRGRRDLGVRAGEPYRGPGSLFCERCAMGDSCREHDPVDAPDRLAEDLEELERTDPVVGAVSARLDETVREIATRATARSRQREQNAAFQAEHLRRREYGLKARYRAKGARNAIRKSDS